MHQNKTFTPYPPCGVSLTDEQKQLQYTIEKESHWDKTQINKMV